MRIDKTRHGDLDHNIVREIRRIAALPAGHPEKLTHEQMGKKFRIHKSRISPIVNRRTYEYVR